MNEIQNHETMCIAILQRLFHMGTKITKKGNYCQIVPPLTTATLPLPQSQIQEPLRALSTWNLPVTEFQ